MNDTKLKVRLTTNEIREKYLRFFEKKAKHKIIDSSRLVPENDPTTLFTGSGMQPMLPYLLGQSHPLGTRIVDSQKCFRSQDIEEVGDNRHTTFFEMLGNWSFGDYFKEQQIDWMWEFITQELKLDPSRLYFTCFEGALELGIPRDDFSAQRWQMHFKNIGIEAKIGDKPEQDGMRDSEKIFFYNAKKNWWSRVGVPANMPLGEPGGPDTEMFYDFEPDAETRCLHAESIYKDEPCHVNCDCGRFMEIGNNVFMEYVRTENGFEFLKQKNVDFGAGLERMAAAVNDDSDMFRIDIFENVIDKIEQLSGKKYNPKKDTNEVLGADKETQSFRVILDHLRAATFLICDGVNPSNKDQGYFVRRLIRRAVKLAKNLGIENNFTSEISKEYIKIYKAHYTDLSANEMQILEALDKEEKQFRVTLEKGLKEFAKSKLFKDKNNIDELTLDEIAKELFFFYQSLGFPFELMLDILKENGLNIKYSDLLNLFEIERKSHAALSRFGSADKFKGGLADASDIVVKYHTATHLLHQALKEVLGNEVNQKGSNITTERLRFDFSYGQKMKEEEIKQVEEKVNEWIKQDVKVLREEVSKEEAISRGAIHLFGEKYGDIVSVYTMGNLKDGESKNKKENKNIISIEFCGGPHIESTGVLSKFKIIKEEAVSAGVRRIKAVIS